MQPGTPQGWATPQECALTTAVAVGNTGVSTVSSAKTTKPPDPGGFQNGGRGRGRGETTEEVSTMGLGRD